MKQLKDQTGGLVLDVDPDQLPDSLEEADIFLETNIKTDAEIAAQVATNMTLSWNNFNDGTYRRCVNDLAAIGMAVVKRPMIPTTVLRLSTLIPLNFIHSYTDDPFFENVVYAGHIKEITLSELKRLAGPQLDEEDFKKIMKVATKRSQGHAFR